MTAPVVVDTNVLLVANGQHTDVSPLCVGACIQCLLDIQRAGCVALDDGYKILAEYQHKTSHQQGKGVGDVFLKGLLRNAVRSVKTPITPHAQRGYDSFPDEASLANFDPADRKFVAVAAALTPPAPIMQAADSKWLDWSGGLGRHGIRVDFLCPQDLARFAQAKAKQQPVRRPPGLAKRDMKNRRAKP